jgi:superfamily II DNA or RNA helicase
LASLKEQIALFPRPRVLSARSVLIDAPEVFDDGDTYYDWGLTGGTEEYPFLQPPKLEVDAIDESLPLRSYIEEHSLIQPITIEELPAEKTVPLQGQIIDYIDRKPIFETLFEFQAFEENLLTYLTQFEIDRLPEGFLDEFIEPFVIQIERNKLRRIYPPDKVMGMNYASRYWEETKVHLPGFERRRKVKKRGKSIRSIQRGQLGKKQVGYSKHTPSFWDLIFILLQPPLLLDVPESLALPHDLYPYQVKGIEFLISNDHALLADDMGTGKTVMTLVALKIIMQQRKARKALIVCPPSVLHEWKRHLEDWTPDLVSTFVRGPKNVRKAFWNYPSHVYVTAYSSLRNDVRTGLMPENYQSQYDLIVLDEAHHIKNPTTAQSRAVKTFSPKYRWALTGTPVQNKIDDMVALFEFVYPDLLSSFDTEERMKIKVGPHFLRRRKQEVMPELPPKIRQDLDLELDRDQHKAYKEIEHESQLEISALGNKVTKRHIFAKLTKLKQICNFAPGRGTSPKLEDMLERVEEIVQSGQKVLVFSQYRNEGINKLERGLKAYKYAKIIGGQSDAQRGDEIEKFKFRKDVSILLASVRSGGEGLNLEEASYVIHFDHWWNPAVMWQAEDRAHRRGQENSVNIYSYWMQDTIDERIRNILARKGLLIESVVDGLAEKEVEELFTMDDLLEVIGVKKPLPEEPKFDPGDWQNLDLEQIHKRLYEIDPYEFEELISQLMHYLGFPNVKVTKRSGDGGVDVLSSRNTSDGIERIAAQCKRYKNPIGVKIAREFLGAIQDDETIVKGYLITTSDFTTDCRVFCNRNGIEMIPGLQVANYVRMFSLKT